MGRYGGKPRRREQGQEGGQTYFVPPGVGWRDLEARDNDVVREMGERQGFFSTLMGKLSCWTTPSG